MMGSSRRDQLDDQRLRHLVEAYCNGTATDAEFVELEQRLGHDAEARDFYRRYMSLESALLDYGDTAAGLWSQDASPPSESIRPPRVSRRLIAVTMACALIAAGLLAWHPWRDGAKVQQLPMIGVLEELSGPVTVAGAEGEVRSARRGTAIMAGDTVRTQKSQSAATLVYPDGTRFSLVGKTAITCNLQKSVTIHGGTVFASVAVQPSGKPMRVATLTDSLEILGTRFTLDATTAETDLSVKEGRVRLTRLSDGQSVEVPAGQRVVSNAQSHLILEKIPPAPDEWAIDFEDGLPPDWAIGKLVATNLSSGPSAAVQSVRVPSNQGAFEIATATGWAYGLFAVHGDSHLHMTFKMKNPGWFNVFLLTRTEEGDPPRFAGNYIFDEPGWWPKQADRWVNVTIPLTAFRPLPPAREAFQNAVPFQVLLSSPQEDRGLVIAHIAVTRGGPGRVVTKELP